LRLLQVPFCHYKSRIVKGREECSRAAVPSGQKVPTVRKLCGCESGCARRLRDDTGRTGASLTSAGL